jgi:hypothetical protein
MPVFQKNKIRISTQSTTVEIKFDFYY